MRLYHSSKGDPCEACGLCAFLHPSPKKIKRKKRYDRSRNGSRKAERVIIGIDGEGYDAPDGRHLYTYLCAADETGRVLADAFNESGLSLDECLSVFFRLPKDSLKVGFMFSYDTTKIIESLPPLTRYRLVRPEYQRQRICKDCGETWQALRGRCCPDCGTPSKHSFTGFVEHEQYGFKWFSGSLTVAKKERHGFGNSVQVWDVFKFFQTSFVEAIKDWNVATSEQIERIQTMKDQRGSFESVDPSAIRRYCQEECVLLARMMRKVIEAHKSAGFPLKRYEGAGSSASALLKKYSVASFRGTKDDELDEGLSRAIRHAYFGGRFENSFMGEIKTRVYSADIASAYPYALSFLPCLACGKWRHVDRYESRPTGNQSLTLVRFQVLPLPDSQRKRLAWAPLPFRDKDGSITYPLNFAGWAWEQELLPALKHWPWIVKTGEAWVYETACKHRPFGFMPEIYRERCRLGKEQAKPFKLGMNASYGKCAQTVGDDPPFRSLVWAGACTATARGMLLEAIGATRDPSNVLALATDAVFSSETLNLPGPQNTGTGDLPKPLGCWELKEPTPGAFFVKPGLYFRADVSEPSDMRARGIGRKEFFTYKETIIRELKRWDRKNFDAGVRLASRRFYGAKTSILVQSYCYDCELAWPGLAPCRGCGAPGRARVNERMIDGRALYGTWDKRKIIVRFDPRPKRESVDVRTGRLRIRDVGGRESRIYEKGKTSPEGHASRQLRELLLEQPDADPQKYFEEPNQ